MIVQCPDCKTKMAPKVAADVKPGTKIGVTCRCGTKLRFTMPGAPRNLAAEQLMDQLTRARGVDDLMGGIFRSRKR